MNAPDVKSDINAAYGIAVQQPYVGGRFETSRHSLWSILNEKRISWLDVLLFAVISTIPSLLLSLIFW
jgi:hypothetical protein